MFLAQCREVNAWRECQLDGALSLHQNRCVDLSQLEHYNVRGLIGIETFERVSMLRFTHTSCRASIKPRRWMTSNILQNWLVPAAVRLQVQIRRGHGSSSLVFTWVVYVRAPATSWSLILRASTHSDSLLRENVAQLNRDSPVSVLRDCPDSLFRFHTYDGAETTGAVMPREAALAATSVHNK